jgi:hypothetical protein
MFQRFVLALAAAVKVEGVITNACCRPYESKLHQRTMYFHEYVLNHNHTYVEKFMDSPLCNFKVGETVSFFCEDQTFKDHTELCIVKKSMRKIANLSTPPQSTPTLLRQPLCDATPTEAAQEEAEKTPSDNASNATTEQEQPIPPQNDLTADQQIRLRAIQLVKDGYLVPNIQGGTKIEAVKGLIQEWVTAATILAEYITTGQQPQQPTEQVQQLHAFPYEQRQVVMPEIPEPVESTTTSRQVTPTAEVATISAPVSSPTVTATSAAEQP